MLQKQQPWCHPHTQSESGMHKFKSAEASTNKIAKRPVRKETCPETTVSHGQRTNYYNNDWILLSYVTKASNETRRQNSHHHSE